MSTRSNIAFRLHNGTIISVYCHWDGYPQNNGNILLRSYNDEDKIVSLLRGGAFSSLRPNIKKVSYFSKKDDWEYCKPSFYATEEDWLKGDLEEWGYLFKDGAWFVVDCHCKTEDRKLVPLTKSYIEDYDKQEKKEYLRYAFEESADAKKPFTYEVLRDKFGVTKKMAKALFDDGFFAKTKDGFIVI